MTKPTIGKTGALTGRVRVRRGWFNLAIAQVEYCTIDVPPGSNRIEPTVKWRDATPREIASMSAWTDVS